MDVEFLKWLNLSNDKVAETLKNASLTERLSRIIACAKDELSALGGGEASKQQV